MDTDKKSGRIPTNGQSMVGLKASIKEGEKLKQDSTAGRNSPKDPKDGGDDSFDLFLPNEFADDTDSCTCSVCQRARNGLSPISRSFFTLEVVEWMGDLTAAISRIFFTIFWICASVTHTLSSYNISVAPVAAVQGFCWQVSESFFIIASFFYCYLSYLEWVSCDRVRFLYSFGIIYMMASTSNLLVKLEQQRWIKMIKTGSETLNDLGWFIPNETNGTISMEPT
ncbi:hypothetical protein AAMO2058_000456300 [Amorphochlora amoebiformis]|eukprot:1371307-Amorphochlora_amoeboformis.AAC.3